MFFNRNVFGHYEGVDRALFRALFQGLFRALFRALDGSARALVSTRKSCFFHVCVCDDTAGHLERDFPETRREVDFRNKQSSSLVTFGSFPLAVSSPRQLQVSLCNHRRQNLISAHKQYAVASEDRKVFSPINPTTKR